MRAKLKKNTANKQNIQDDIRVFDAPAQNWVDRFCPVITPPLSASITLGPPDWCVVAVYSVFMGGVGGQFYLPQYRQNGLDYLPPAPLGQF